MSVVPLKMRQCFDPDFKNRAIELAIRSSQPIGKTAKELGLKETTLYQWVRKHKSVFLKKNPKQGPAVYDELTILRKENARLKEERDILKKAAQYFAKESERSTNL